MSELIKSLKLCDQNHAKNIVCYCTEDQELLCSKCLNAPKHLGHEVQSIESQVHSQLSKIQDLAFQTKKIKTDCKLILGQVNLDEILSYLDHTLSSAIHKFIEKLNYWKEEKMKQILESNYVKKFFQKTQSMHQRIQELKQLHSKLISIQDSLSAVPEERNSLIKDNDNKMEDGLDHGNSNLLNSCTNFEEDNDEIEEENKEDNIELIKNCSSACARFIKMKEAMGEGEQILKTLGEHKKEISDDIIKMGQKLLKFSFTLEFNEHFIEKCMESSLNSLDFVICENESHILSNGFLNRYPEKLIPKLEEDPDPPRIILEEEKDKKPLRLNSRPKVGSADLSLNRGKSRNLIQQKSGFGNYEEDKVQNSKLVSKRRSEDSWMYVNLIFDNEEKKSLESESLIPSRSNSNIDLAKPFLHYFKFNTRLLCLYNLLNRNIFELPLNIDFNIPGEFDSVQCNFSIYMGGGTFDNVKILKTFYELDLDRQTLVTRTSMIKARKNHFLIAPIEVLAHHKYKFSESIPFSFHKKVKRLGSYIKPESCRHHIPDPEEYDFSFQNYSSEIYALGGYNKQGFLSSCEKYNILQNKWFKLPSFNRPRAQTSATQLGKYLYCFGGWNGEQLSSIEKLRITKEANKSHFSWRVVNVKQIENIQCLEDKEGSLHWVEDISSKGGIASSVLSYFKRVGLGGSDKKEKKKDDLKKLNHLLSRVTSGIQNINQNEVLVFGGFWEPQNLVSCYKFNSSSKSIQIMKDMIKADSFYQHKSIFWDNKIYAIGYENNDLHVWNSKTESWKGYFQKPLEEIKDNQ